LVTADWMRIAIASSELIVTGEYVSLTGCFV